MAAWCHDSGYAPELVLTGFHPLDGASYLRRIGASDRVVSLVAHHSFAALEASLRGMQAEMANYTDEQGSIRDALWYCDLTTSPDGQPVSASERIAEIKQRYGPDDLVTRFISDATPELLAAVGRTARAIDLATGERCDGPLFLTAHGRRLDD